MWGMVLMSFTKAQQGILLNIAYSSIAHGLQHGKALPIVVQDYQPALQVTRATFVTLNLNKQLRGCIGTLTAILPLVVDVAQRAYGAAFSDYRFSSLQANEFPKLNIHISVLSEPESIQFSSENDLFEQLRPNIDGLILVDGQHKSTFLPAVWESLNQPQEFVQQLKRKAGLPTNYWSNTMEVYRYITESFGASACETVMDKINT